MFAVGGWTDSNDHFSKYSSMINNANLRKNFITSVVSFLKTYNFDGVVLDLEYPTNKEKAIFLVLNQALKKALKQNNWELDIAAPVNAYLINQGYLAKQLCS